MNILKPAFTFLDLLNDVNEKAGKISEKDFYNDAINKELFESEGDAFFVPSMDECLGNV